MKIIKRGNRVAHRLVVLMLTAMIGVSAQAETHTAQGTASSQQPRTVDWTALIPEDDLEALLNPPDYITDIEDGSLEDQVSDELHNALAAASDDRYQAALASTKIRPELDGQTIRLPGFVVPLEYGDERRVTQFFLVPYFGACIHLPPPPPNQVVWVDYPQGLELPDLYQPFWISGVLTTSMTKNSEATSAYAMTVQSYEMYDERYEE